MNLKQMPDETLLAQTEKLVKEEREILTTVLHHLKEIERRRLFSTLKFGSLYEYCTKKLAYSEDQAYRRIAAMRLLREIPELGEKINSGLLTLTHLGMAQSHFRKEQKSEKVMSRTEKIEILEKLENKTTREAEKIVFSLSSDSLPLVTEKIKTISRNHVEIKFIANSELVEKIQKLKNALAHANPGISLAELFDRLCDLGLEELNKTAAPRKAPANKSKTAILREVKERGECENCGSDYALEVDHIYPQALGGGSNLENLRLLCRSCNQRSAIEYFGIQKMEPYIQKRH